MVRSIRFAVPQIALRRVQILAHLPASLRQVPRRSFSEMPGDKVVDGGMLRPPPIVNQVSKQLEK